MEVNVQTKLYDSADYLDSETAIVTYLKLAFEEGDAVDIGVASRNVMRVLSFNPVLED